MLCGKGRIRTRTLGTKAERYDHCTTRPIYLVYTIVGIYYCEWYIQGISSQLDIHGIYKVCTRFLYKVYQTHLDIPGVYHVYTWYLLIIGVPDESISDDFKFEYFILHLTHHFDKLWERVHDKWQPREF